MQWRQHAEPRPAPRDRRRPRRRGAASPARVRRRRAGSPPRCSTTSASSTPGSACSGGSVATVSGAIAGRDMADAWSRALGLHPPGRALPAPPRARRATASASPAGPRRRPRGRPRTTHRTAGAAPASPSPSSIALVAADDLTVPSTPPTTPTTLGSLVDVVAGGRSGDAQRLARSRLTPIVERPRTGISRRQRGELAAGQ